MGTGCKPVGSAYIGSNPIAPIASLGYGQVVRHRFLVPCIAGSNPAIPANEVDEHLLVGFFVIFFQSTA